MRNKLRSIRRIESGKTITYFDIVDFCKVNEDR